MLITVTFTYLAIYSYWAVIGRMHAQDSRLRGIDDGSTHQRAKNSSIRNSESATIHIFHRQCPISCLNT